jgi:hypothetical protein
VAEALGCAVSDLRQGERVARSKWWRQALVNLSDISSSAPPDPRPWDAEEQPSAPSSSVMNAPSPPPVRQKDHHK